MNKDLLVNSSITILQAMKALNKSAEKCLIVVDNNQMLLGTLSDGDIRRSILDGNNFKNSIEKSYNSSSKFLVNGKYTTQEARQIMLSNKIDLLPILDTDKKVIDRITWNEVFSKDEVSTKDSLSIPVVVMAGGKGTRLKPFTDVLPKPLVPLGGKPIIEHIIERFTNIGANEFYATVNYKGKILKSYFEELDPDYSISFVDEKEPLGTAGSLKYLSGKFDTPFFVTNCDIIIEANYSSLYKFHLDNSNDITLVASAKEYVIPYGTCELNNQGYLSHINEKPTYNFLINTGLYVLNPEILEFIPSEKFYHITHLIEDLKNKGKKVGVYPIDDDSWIDVGEWAEFRKAAEKF